MNLARQLLALILWLLVTFVAGWFGSQFSGGEWLDTLRKPSFYPPEWLFGPVWSLLYLMMGVAVWLVWKRAGFKGAALAIGLYFVQLVLNGLWSWLFFGLHAIGLALVEIVLLLAAIVLTAIAFWQHRRGAALLLIPYVAWVTFATALNYALWQLNR